MGARSPSARSPARSPKRVLSNPADRCHSEEGARPVPSKCTIARCASRRICRMGARSPRLRLVGVKALPLPKRALSNPADRCHSEEGARPGPFQMHHRPLRRPKNLPDGRPIPSATTGRREDPAVPETSLIESRRIGVILRKARAPVPSSAPSPVAPSEESAGWAPGSRRLRWVRREEPPFPTEILRSARLTAARSGRLRAAPSSE
jgi:hypothetical protein